MLSLDTINIDASHCCGPQVFLTLERTVIKSLLWMCCYKCTQVFMRECLVLKDCIAKYRIQPESWFLLEVYSLFYSCQCGFWRVSHVTVDVLDLEFLLVEYFSVWLFLLPSLHLQSVPPLSISCPYCYCHFGWFVIFNDLNTSRKH